MEEEYIWSKPSVIKGLAKKKVGRKLARLVADKLKIHEGLFNRHRHYCGQGIVFTDGEFRLLEVHDGRPEWSKVLASWTSENEFIDFLASQSTFTLSGADEKEKLFFTSRLFALNNQRITRSKLEDYVSAKTNGYCPFCNKILRSKKARQCPHCLEDWHDRE